MDHFAVFCRKMLCCFILLIILLAKNKFSFSSVTYGTHLKSLLLVYHTKPRKSVFVKVGGSPTQVIYGMVESNVKLDGKTVLITGCNTGIGYETVLDLASRGARIIMACRDIGKAEKAKAEVLEQIKDAKLIVKELDLASLNSVREFAEDINQTESRLDILINNAGVMMCPYWKTKDGFEMQMGTNHVGHFLLTDLLLDLTKKSAPSRIVIVSSYAYKRGSIDFDDIMCEKNYNPLHAYYASKVANIFHCTELSKRLEGSGVTVNCLHPGRIHTDLGRYLSGGHMPFFVRVAFTILSPFARWLVINPKQGAQTTIYCAVAPELNNVSGKFFANCAEEELLSHAKKQDDAEKLWKLSEEWVKKGKEENN